MTGEATLSLPIGEALTPSELEQRFEIREVQPPHNPDHAFRIRVPRGWEPHHLESMDREVDNVQLTPLAAWQGPGPDDDSPPIFHVQAARLEREISAKNFMLVVAATKEMSLHLVREVNPKLADALLEQEIQGVPFFERTLVSIDGDRVYYLTGIARADRYLPLQETFGAMMGSFRTTRPSPKQNVETWERYALVPGDVRFEHPASWRPLLVDGSDDQRAIVSLYGLDAAGNIGGIIHVEAERGRPLPLDDEYERLLAICAGQNIRPTADPEEVGVDVEGGRFRALGSRRYPAMIDGNELDQEISITLLEADDLALRVWMTTPAKKGSFIHWGINRRALEILLGTLR